MKTDNLLSSTLSKVVMYILFVFAILFLVLVVVRMFHLNNVDKTSDVVAKIHATKLTLDDVMGKNLPPDPGALADQTIQGIDANKNGIRDDVELAIFKTYPNSAKTRAVLLQYALVLQMQMTLPLINKETVTATVEDKSRANVCMWSLSSRSDMKKFSADMEKYRNYTENLQLNNESRKQYLYNLIENNLGSYTASNSGCDLDLSTLLN